MLRALPREHPSVSTHKGLSVGSTFCVGCRQDDVMQHMNHGPAFQALWSQLRREVGELQSKGYYGDGN